MSPESGKCGSTNDGHPGIVRCFTIVNRLGLHARAAAALVQVARRFSSDIRLEKAGKEVSAKSIMSILQLAAMQGHTVRVIAQGPDSLEALQAIGSLITDRFGEPE